MKGLCEWPQTLDPWFSIEVFAILDTKTMADIFPDPAWLKIYSTLKFGLFFVLFANIFAVLDPIKVLCPNQDGLFYGLHPESKLFYLCVLSLYFLQY